MWSSWGLGYVVPRALADVGACHRMVLVVREFWVVSPKHCLLLLTWAANNRRWHVVVLGSRTHGCVNLVYLTG